MSDLLRARHGPHRFLCHWCDWEWPMHFWLPFDFQLARIAHRRHVRRKHTPRNGPPLIGGIDWGLGMFLVCMSLAACAVLSAPEARAWPTCDGGYSVGSPWGGYCDGIPETTGQHWHCQWGMGFSLCEWRWPDNTVAPNPYTPAAMP